MVCEHWILQFQLIFPPRFLLSHTDPPFYNCIVCHALTCLQSNSILIYLPLLPPGSSIQMALNKCGIWIHIFSVQVTSLNHSLSSMSVNWCPSMLIRTWCRVSTQYVNNSLYHHPNRCHLIPWVPPAVCFYFIFFAHDSSICSLCCLHCTAFHWISIFNIPPSCL